VYSFKNTRLPKEPEKGKGVPVDQQGTYALWEDFLACVKDGKRETLSTPEMGAAAFTTVSMGVRSYREGKVLFWDAQKQRPVDADASWAKNLEAKSKKHGKPNQVQGWKGGDAGSVVYREKYQDLEGPWTDGKDPAPQDKSDK